MGFGKLYEKKLHMPTQPLRYFRKVLQSRANLLEKLFSKL